MAEDAFNARMIESRKVLEMSSGCRAEVNDCAAARSWVACVVDNTKRFECRLHA